MDSSQSHRVRNEKECWWRRAAEKGKPSPVHRSFGHFVQPRPEQLRKIVRRGRNRPRASRRDEGIRRQSQTFANTDPFRLMRFATFLNPFLRSRVTRGVMELTLQDIPTASARRRGAASHSMRDSH
jgi:hypothetical protein